ncbi:hypothetical protein KR018_004067, partial [Drosophila ironensis]
MKAKDSNIIFIMTFIILTVCGVCIWKFSGFSHEPVKINRIMVSFIAVTLIQATIFMPFKFAVISIDEATWPAPHPRIAPPGYAEVDTLMGNLSNKLRCLRSEVMITERHRNERLNLKYRLIAEEVRIFGLFFLVMFALVMVQFNEALFFNTAAVTRLFEFSQIGTSGLSTITRLPEVYTFMELSLIKAFTIKNQRSGGAPWVHSEPTVLLGMVRLQQLRTRNRCVGLRHPVYTTDDFSEGWKLPYTRESYTNKFWKIYQPWVAKLSSFFDRTLWIHHHRGLFITYPSSMGYENMLSDTRAKSMMVLKYLKNHNWLDRNTSALFMDFTLYNADANIFTVCTLWVEQLPFGMAYTHMEIDSIVFVEQMRDLTPVGLLALVLFVVFWLQFVKLVFVRIWYEPMRLRGMWVQLDIVIMVLCVVVVAATAARDNVVQIMIRELEISVNVQFIDFNDPRLLNEVVKVTSAFTVALVTMRLWKVMQFAGTFKIFTKTIYMAWDTLLCTIVITVIFLVAISSAAVILNGNSTSAFHSLMQGMVAVSCFSFGYNSNLDVSDLFYGGKWIGVVLYTIMGFVVRVLLINLFISMLKNHLSLVKAKKEETRRYHNITFIEFLRVEYADAIRFVRRFTCPDRGYKRKNRTVAENIRRKLDYQQRIGPKGKMQAFFTIKHVEPVDDRYNQVKYEERIERSMKVSAVLQLQMELIARVKFGDEDGNLSAIDETSTTSSSSSSS